MEATSISRPFSGIPWKPYFLAIGTLATLAIYVLAWAYPTFSGDEDALLQFQAMRNGWLDDMAIWPPTWDWFGFSCLPPLLC